jgi:hypothetical protein
MRTSFSTSNLNPGDGGARISPAAFSAVLLVGSVVWLVGAWGWYSAGGLPPDARGTSTASPLILLLTPSICFAFGVALVNARQRGRLSAFDRCALGAACLPVTLGSWLALLVVNAWFWAGFLEAPVGLRLCAAVALLALILVTGVVIWRTTRNYLSGTPRIEVG